MYTRMYSFLCWRLVASSADAAGAVSCSSEKAFLQATRLVNRTFSTSAFKVDAAVRSSLVSVSVTTCRGVVLMQLHDLGPWQPLTLKLYQKRLCKFSRKRNP